MKKLIFATIAALSMAAFGITADEAYASKNYKTIRDYCVTNNLGFYAFVCRTNNADIATYAEIYNSFTNALGQKNFDMVWNGYSYYPVNEANTLPYEYNKQTHQSIVRKVNGSNPKYIQRFAYYCKKNYSMWTRLYDFVKEDMEKTTWFDSSATAAANLDKAIGNNVLKDILYPRCTDASAKLTMAIGYNDVDKIIDNLLLVNDVTAVQAEGVIKPINAIENSYRKEDVLKALVNLNSRCTIKLYEDQKTWEPILAKIRAMISVRQ